MPAQITSQPTQEGVTRYPPSGYYMPDDLGVEMPLHLWVGLSSDL